MSELEALAWLGGALLAVLGIFGLSALWFNAGQGEELPRPTRDPRSSIETFKRMETR